MTALHGGAIWAESEGVDKGASFTIELPVEASRLPMERVDASHDLAR